MDELIWLLAGIFFTCVGACVAISHLITLKRFKNDGFEVEATIFYVKPKRKGHYSRNIYINDLNRVYISYELLGKVREAQLSYTSSSMNVGDKIRIYVDNFNHDKFVYAGTGPMVFGIQFSVMGLFLILLHFMK